MDKYLTPELKQYYMNDFNEKIVPLTNDSWKLDDGVLEYLQIINANPLVQTLYSKMYSISKRVNNDQESYLMFAYSKELEDTIFKQFLSDTTSAFSLDDDSKCYFAFNYPESELDEDDEDNEDNEDNVERIDIGCVRDGKYFNVNHIRIYFSDYDQSKHVLFWEFVSKRLSELGVGIDMN